MRQHHQLPQLAAQFLFHTVGKRLSAFTRNQGRPDETAQQLHRRRRVLERFVVAALRHHQRRHDKRNQRPDGDLRSAIQRRAERRMSHHAAREHDQRGDRRRAIVLMNRDQQTQRHQHRKQQLELRQLHVSEREGRGHGRARDRADQPIDAGACRPRRVGTSRHQRRQHGPEGLRQMKGLRERERADRRQHHPQSVRPAATEARRQFLPEPGPVVADGYSCVVHVALLTAEAVHNAGHRN